MPLFTTKRKRTSRRRRAAPARSSRTGSILLNPKRSRRRRKARRNYWPNNTQGHRSAARKGWKKRKVRLSLVRDRSGRRRKNPMRSRKHTVRRAYRRNPLRSRRYARRRHVRRNPLNLRTLTNKSTLMTAATIGVGLAAGFMTLPVVSRILPADWRSQIESATGWGKARGLINVAIGVLIFSMLKNKRAKEIGIVIAGTGVYDLIAVNLQSQLGLPTLSATNAVIDKLMPAAGASYGTPGSSVVAALAGNPHAAQAMAGSYGQNVVPSYGPSAYGASYESPVMKAFGDDLDAFMS